MLTLKGSPQSGRQGISVMAPTLLHDNMPKNKPEADTSMEDSVPAGQASTYIICIIVFLEVINLKVVNAYI